jgi:hypothetical protein
MEYKDIRTLKVTTSATSAQSGAIGDGVFAIRLICTASSHFVINPDPTATVNDAYIPANTEYYLGVKPADKIAVRTTSGGGIAFITELSK